MKNLPKIFIVEDDAFFASILKNSIIKNNLLDVQTYRSGEDCLDNLYKNPDIVLLDYQLTEMNGIEVLDRIKSINSLTKVILISSQEKASIVIKSLQNGAFGYLEKNNLILRNLNTFLNMCLNSHNAKIE
jgi:DNA-binding NtrC family response regulator